MTNKKWISIYTKSRHEKVVAKKLVENGFEVYLPMLREKRKWSDRKKWVEFPLFKSYMFVKTEIKESISIVKVPNVVKIIRFGKKIAIIKDDTINSLKLMIQGNCVAEVENYFLRGDLVKIKHGPLKGFSGEVIRKNNKKRLLLRVDAIQQSISIEVDTGLLELK